MVLGSPFLYQVLIVTHLGLDKGSPLWLGQEQKATIFQAIVANLPDKSAIAQQQNEWICSSIEHLANSAGAFFGATPFRGSHNLTPPCPRAGKPWEPCPVRPNRRWELGPKRPSNVFRCFFLARVSIPETLGVNTPYLGFQYS